MFGKLLPFVMLMMVMGSLALMMAAQRDTAEAERMHMEMLMTGTATPSRQSS